jgi:hypothetical protein
MVKNPEPGHRAENDAMIHLLRNVPVLRNSPVRNLLLALATGTALYACTPTIRVEVAPINIYAKLDADVRVRLDKEVQNAIQQNPDLF